MTLKVMMIRDQHHLMSCGSKHLVQERRITHSCTLIWRNCSTSFGLFQTPMLKCWKGFFGVNAARFEKTEPFIIERSKWFLHHGKCIDGQRRRTSRIRRDGWLHANNDHGTPLYSASLKKSEENCIVARKLRLKIQLDFIISSCYVLASIVFGRWANERDI